MSKIKEMPLNERPREKGMMYGLDNLSNEELFAILIGSGTKGKSSLDIARELLSSTSSLKELVSTSYLDLKSFKGISNAKALLLASVFEIFKRINLNDNEIKTIYNSKEDIARYFISKLQNEPNEHVFVVIMNNLNRLIAIRNLYIGSNSNVSFDPREVTKILARFNAKKFFLIHNHPSNSVYPSSYDEELTRVLIAYSATIGVSMIDHLIVGKNKYYSLVEEKEYDL